MKSHLKFAIFGSSLVSAYWNGAATYYRGLIRALHHRGHQITFYEPDAFGRQRHRDIDDPSWAKVVVYRSERPEDALNAVEQAHDADVVIKASGVGVHDALLEATMPQLKSPSHIVAFLDVDAPATLDRISANQDDPFRDLIPQYDMVLTYGGGDPVVDAYTKAGARVCVPIYNALDPDTHHPVPPNERFAADLGFLGNRLPDREARVEQFFIAAAKLAPAKQFILGGSGWDDKPMPTNIRRLGHVYTHEHNAFNCTAAAVLNINRASMARFGFSPPTRVFEAAGAGACLITDAWEGIELFLEPNTEVLVARSGDEVAAHLDSLTPARAREIGQAARRRMLTEHTYAHRAAQLEALLQGKTKTPALCALPT